MGIGVFLFWRDGVLQILVNSFQGCINVSWFYVTAKVFIFPTFVYAAIVSQHSEVSAFSMLNLNWCVHLLQKRFLEYVYSKESYKLNFVGRTHAVDCFER